MSMIADRAFTALNLKQYNRFNLPDLVGRLQLQPTDKDYYVLRMLIKNSSGGYRIPKELMWTYPLVALSQEYQDKIGVAHSFCYLTIRTKSSRTSDAWHVDGFSTKVTHLPEQNYIWCSKEPTLVYVKKFKFLKAFNPSKHNIHWFFQDRINLNDPNGFLDPLEAQTVYCMDPYIIHRRPDLVSDDRMFIRVSHTPIEINDINNTINPLISTNYIRDGVKEFRDKLERF